MDVVAIKVNYRNSWKPAEGNVKPEVLQISCQ